MSIGWIEADWPAPPGVRAGCTTRAGGVSDGDRASLNPAAHVGDEPASVAENRRRIASALSLPSPPRWLNQVHGRDVAVEPGDDVPTADGSVTRQPGVPLAILTADCLPVLLCSTDGGVLGAAHGGWRGLAAGVLAATVAGMGHAPASLLAWLGPAISAPNFEVGPEVRAAFVALSADYADCFRGNDRGRFQADIYAIGRVQLAQAGVQDIYGGGFCTFADDARFFSYRRQPGCGRMASLLWRENR